MQEENNSEEEYLAFLEDLNSPDEDDDTPAVVPVQEVSFIRAKPHDLTTMLSCLTKVQRKAISRLVGFVEDEDTNPKIALESAKALLSFQIQVSKEINTDAVSRLKEEISLKGLRQTKLIEPEKETDSTPDVDFDNIQEF